MTASPLSDPDDELEKLLHELIEIQGHSLEEDVPPSEFTPETIEALYGMGHQMYTTGAYGQASHIFRVLTLLDAGRKRNWMTLASSLQMTKQFEEAVEMYSIAGLMDENDPYVHFHAAECLYLVGDKDRGIMALNSAEEIAAGQQVKDINLINRLALFKQVWCNDDQVKNGASL